MEWISCLDRLPQTSVAVLGWDRIAQACKVVVLRFGEEEWISDEVESDDGLVSERLPLAAISHWAHLPDAPGAGGDEGS